MSTRQPNDEWPSQPSAVEETALQWVTRCDRGLDAAEKAEFEQWLQADPCHRRLFEEFDGVFDLVSRTDPAPAVRGTVVRDDAAASTGRKGRRFSRAWVALAAAAALTIGYHQVWRPAHFSRAFETATGEMRTVKLPDGSALEMNTQSEVAVTFTSAERRVQLLRGEGHFNVAKDAARPFVVATHGVAVKAIGTRFNVRVRGESVDVLVTEGKVQVEPVPAAAPTTPAAASAAVPPDAARRAPEVTGEGKRTPEPILLTAGYRISIEARSLATVAAEALAEPRAVRLPADEIRRQLAWQERKLEFESARLAEIVHEMNRYHQRRIVIADPILSTQRFGGSFRPEDRAGFVRMLQDNFGVIVEERADESVIRLAPPSGR